MAQISQARKQYEEARTALLGQNAEYEKQQAACESGRAQYNTASAQLAQAQSVYQESLNTYEAAKAACDAAQTELDGKKTRLSEVQQQITALTAQKAEAAKCEEYIPADAFGFAADAWRKTADTGREDRCI